MNKRDSFIFYRSFYEAMEDLSNEDQLIIYRAIAVFALEDVEPDISGYPKAIFKLIRPILEANNNRWKNGKKGGAPKGNLNNPNGRKTKNQPKTNQDLTMNQANKDKDKDKDVDLKEKNIKEIFEVFFNSYHSVTGLSKTDKQAAFNYFKKLSKEEQTKAQENIQSYFDSLKDKNYCKKCRTYLSDKNFNDEFKQTNETEIYIIP